MHIGKNVARRRAGERDTEQALSVAHRRGIVSFVVLLEYRRFVDREIQRRLPIALSIKRIIRHGQQMGSQVGGEENSLLVLLTCVGAGRCNAISQKTETGSRGTASALSSAYLQGAFRRHRHLFSQRTRSSHS